MFIYFSPFQDIGNSGFFHVNTHKHAHTPSDFSSQSKLLEDILINCREAAGSHTRMLQILPLCISFRLSATLWKPSNPGALSVLTSGHHPDPFPSQGFLAPPAVEIALRASMRVHVCIAQPFYILTVCKVTDYYSQIKSWTYFSPGDRSEPPQSPLALLSRDSHQLPGFLPAPAPAPLAENEN